MGALAKFIEACENLEVATFELVTIQVDDGDTMITKTISLYDLKEEFNQGRIT